jgi:hypothetical protein
MSGLLHEAVGRTRIQVHLAAEAPRMAFEIPLDQAEQRLA